MGNLHQLVTMKSALITAMLMGIVYSQYLKTDYNHQVPLTQSNNKFWPEGLNKVYNNRGRPEFSEHWPKRQVSNYEAQMSDPTALNVAAKQAELQALLQQLYEAEAAVKMEAGEVSRTQEVAAEAEQALEEATNKVRMLSADLQAAQESAAAAAMRAHTAQLQLSAHDQLMFNARQRADALSSQMVSLQADLASAQQIFTLNNSTQHLEQQGKMMSSLVDPEVQDMGLGGTPFYLREVQPPPKQTLGAPQFPPNVYLQSKPFPGLYQ